MGGLASIHVDHVGYVIGSNGETIKRLQEETHCRVSVVDGSMPGMPMLRNVQIGGRSENDVRECHRAFLEICRHAERARPRVGNMPPHFFGLRVSPLLGYQMVMTIKPEDVGMVVGKKGSTVKQIGYRTYTNIKYFGASADSTESSRSEFSVRGFLERDVEAAVSQIRSIAQESYLRRTGQSNRGGVKKVSFDESTRECEKNSRYHSPPPATVPSGCDSPIYSCDSPDYSPTNPDYMPKTPE